MSMEEDLHEGKPREECGVFAVYGHEEACLLYTSDAADE